VPWVTHLTCPTCRTPEALVVFDGIGTLCRECDDTTCALFGDPKEAM
jgi:hypothetical protein